MAGGVHMKHDKRTQYSPFGIEEQEQDGASHCCGLKHGVTAIPRPTCSQAFFLLAYLTLSIGLTVDEFVQRRSLDLLLQAFTAVPSTQHSALSIVLALLMAASAVVAFPPPLLAVLGGYVFSKMLGPYLGVLASSCVVSLSVTCGSLLAFLVSRAMLRPWASEAFRASDVLEGMDEALRQQGLKLNLLLRLSPLVPCGLINLILGVTGIRIDDFVIGCPMGILPHIIVLGWFGSGLSSLDEVGPYASRWRVEMLALYMVGVVAVAGAGLLLYRTSLAATDQVRKRRASLVDAYGWST